VNNTSVNIEGKLPQGLLELYADVSSHAQALVINYLVVGAMARDLVLVHGFNSTIERGTRDIDFGINVASWDEFHALKNRLLEAGYKNDRNRTHRLYYTDKTDSE
jgi:predicted nucleotidyltransferase